MVAHYGRIVAYIYIYIYIYIHIIRLEFGNCMMIRWCLEVDWGLIGGCFEVPFFGRECNEFNVEHLHLNVLSWSVFKS